jgi:hypothetical protein
MSNINKVTKLQLISILLNSRVSGINGASFIGIDTLTSVKLAGGQKNPMQGKVQKSVTGSSVMVFQNKHINGYEAMVKRRLEKEGKDVEFEVKPRMWGQRIKDTPLVFHSEKGKYYLEVIFLKSGNVSYLCDGEAIEKEEIQGLPEKKTEGSQGGLDSKVIIRTYAIDSITRITLNKETYIIVD